MGTISQDNGMKDQMRVSANRESNANTILVDSRTSDGNEGVQPQSPEKIDLQMQSDVEVAGQNQPLFCCRENSIVHPETSSTPKSTELPAVGACILAIFIFPLIHLILR